mmetsp:Transcript_173865/g.557264  ORF Transcript_173865/g.557264 Transcript_173865/m.557264 type:complete len:329 (+) Transcript_173865:469-1455(+)
MFKYLMPAAWACGSSPKNSEPTATTCVTPFATTASASAAALQFVSTSRPSKTSLSRARSASEPNSAGVRGGSTTRATASSSLASNSSDGGDEGSISTTWRTKSVGPKRDRSNTAPSSTPLLTHVENSSKCSRPVRFVSATHSMASTSLPSNAASAARSERATASSARRIAPSPLMSKRLNSSTSVSGCGADGLSAANASASTAPLGSRGASNSAALPSSTGPKKKRTSLSKASKSSAAASAMDLLGAPSSEGGGSGGAGPRRAAPGCACAGASECEVRRPPLLGEAPRAFAAAHAGALAAARDRDDAAVRFGAALPPTAAAASVCGLH